jgi:hypothetical protein
MAIAISPLGLHPSKPSPYRIFPTPRSIVSRPPRNLLPYDTTVSTPTFPLQPLPHLHNHTDMVTAIHTAPTRPILPYPISPLRRCRLCLTTMGTIIRARLRFPTVDEGTVATRSTMWMKTENLAVVISLQTILQFSPSALVAAIPLPCTPSTPSQTSSKAR